MDAERLDRFRNSEDWRAFCKEIDTLIEQHRDKYDTLNSFQEFLSNRDQIRLLRMIKEYPDTLFEKVSR